MGDKMIDMIDKNFYIRFLGGAVQPICNSQSWEPYEIISDTTIDQSVYFDEHLSFMSSQHQLPVGWRTSATAAQLLDEVSQYSPSSFMEVWRLC